MKWAAQVSFSPSTSSKLKAAHLRSMALQKVLVGVVLMVAVMLMFTPSTSATRGFDVVFESGKAQMEVEDLSLEDQDQVMRLDMDAAKRNLLSYDPYYNKWYGGHGGPPHGGHGGPPYGGPPYGGHGGPPYGGPPYGGHGHN